MKQHITIDDLNQLSEKGKERLRKWWKPILGGPTAIHILENYNFDGYKNKNYWEERIVYDDQEYAYFNFEEKMDGGTNVIETFPLLSIGQMIEFLDEHDAFPEIGYDTRTGFPDISLKKWGVELSGQQGDFNNNELCDALWEAVKEVLF